MSGGELAYLVFTTAGFLFFGLALAGAVHYSNSKPAEARMPASLRKVSS